MTVRKKEEMEKKPLVQAWLKKGWCDLLERERVMKGASLELSLEEGDQVATWKKEIGEEGSLG